MCSFPFLSTQIAENTQFITSEHLYRLVDRSSFTSLSIADVLSFVSPLNQRVSSLLSHQIYANTIVPLLFFRVRFHTSSHLDGFRGNGSDLAGRNESKRFFAAALSCGWARRAERSRACFLFIWTNQLQGYRWFSFESAFVLWRLFCELDSDNDGLLNKKDLRHYGDVCLT